MIVERFEFGYREGRTIRRGQLFRVAGGPVTEDGRPSCLRLYGKLLRFRSAYIQAKRWFVVCDEIDPQAIDRNTGRPTITRTHALFVAGAPFRNRADSRVIMRPYSIRRLRAESARKRGLQVEKLMLPIRQLAEAR
jgi:hypothetical protein